MGRELITQGAEGRVYSTEWLGRSVIVKHRFHKEYRHPDLDAYITRERIKAEARALMRCRSYGIKTPVVYDVDFDKNEIILEKITNGSTIRNYIYEAVKNNLSMESSVMLSIAERIGEVLVKMHSNNIIHGDLTTSNMLLVPPYETSDIILIDFGLSSIDERAEDKAVDLYVLERAILSTHPNTESFVAKILTTYENADGSARDVVKRLNEVRLRGRKKLCFG
ncbi:EKC/KEOPS complex subunit TP53RK-like isoform X2 [Homarus americanus]|uniref:non-specific serine/threonine protein kinase n=2 Tax=Homarus americanus TaxID=6706 RepID=A0A8J5TL98_HOMAM|nr:EKC/KEOPS complex subunit TP53RK-like isoform X2 [Homarus americanus]XP_042213896.1 EKC/KEOPS complex subunit TP53RK-like isoform X2 [Homarus americanus]XP_042213904.1 EKC/KEOPS complex subunit TP53RK-like isoform X2 [Homarus americanus]XP_042213914.1 EKC/KEOPS complex subunit TP53RK-like isoform X2 [Homarus americanus]KAG7177526.1 EKC/KEOPS complex subunit TP53RK-like [Homarus americanus]